MTDSVFLVQLVEDLGTEGVLAVLDVFEKDVIRLTQVLNVAAAANDGAAFRRAAHGMAGAAGAVGAQTLEQAARLCMTRAEMHGPQLVAAAADLERLANVAVVQLGDALAALPRQD